MFGYPTGVGCLLARSKVLATLAAAVVRRRHGQFRHGQRARVHPLVGRGGLRGRDAQLPGDSSRSRSACAIWIRRAGHDQYPGPLPHRLAAASGSSISSIATGITWCASTGRRPRESRGGTITMNFYDPEGHLLDYRRVEEMAGAQGISLRTGCFCNPGAGRPPRASPKPTSAPHSSWTRT